jgi:predicted PurR-regulated permease PerM
MIDLLKTYSTYIVGTVIISLVAYLVYSEYTHLKELSNKDKTILSLSNDITILDSNVTTLNTLLLQSIDECNNKILNIRQNNIQTILDNQIKEIKDEEHKFTNNTGHHVFRVDN